MSRSGAESSANRDQERSHWVRQKDSGVSEENAGECKPQCYCGRVWSMVPPAPLTQTSI